MSRILETVLTGRNLLSPVLTTAAADVTAFNTTVAAANDKAAASAATSAKAQTVAANSTVTAADRAASATASGSTRQAAAAEKIAASNAKASTSASASADVQARSYAKAAESATLSARLQETANRSLTTSNGLLGTSLTPLTAGLGAVALGLGYAAYRGMEFDATMSQVQAATQASASTMDDLRDAAIEQGAKTKYSAEEAAQGITEMAKAGVSTADIMGGGLAGALNLAAAGQISVADAAETGATALSVFKLKGDQMTHVADLLAAGAGKAQGSVGDLSQALNQSALVAHQTGLSVEDTSGALAMFASNGLIGSDAGTSFKTMLQALTPNSLQASKAMDAIGFSAYDAQGNFVGLKGVAGQLRDGLSKLSVEQQNATLKTIFGSDAVRAAAILYNEGADGVAAWRDKVNDAGYAARQAAENQDNLRGDLEKLGGAVDSTMTTIGAGVQGPLRGLTQGLTDIVGLASNVLGFFSGLPAPVQLAVGAFAAWSVAGDTIMEKLNLIKQGMGDGVWGAFTEALGYAQENGDGLGEVLGSVGETALNAAKGGLKALAKAIGPELGMAAATYLISTAVSSIQALTTAGDQAASEIQDLDQSIKDADSNGPKFEAINTGIDTLKKNIVAAKAEIDRIDDENFVKKITIGAFTGEAGKMKDAQESLKNYQAALEDLEGANERADRSIDVLSQRYHISRDEVIAFADAHSIDLTGALKDTDWTFTRLASSTGAFVTQLGTIDSGVQNAYTSMAAYAAALGLDEQGTKDLIDQTNKLGESLGDFIDPLGTYTGMLQAKAQAEADAANATAEQTGAQSKSWQDFTADVTVSLDDYLAQLQTQLDAQTNWQTNMLLLAGRVSQGTLDELARMGPEGAPLVAQLVDASDDELARFSTVTAARSKDATDAWGEQLTLASPVLAAIGRTAGQGVVAELVAQLQAGTTTVADIAAQYGVNLAGGINPVLSALGKQKVVVGGFTRLGQVGVSANGNIFENHDAEIATGGLRIWAEPETGGEAYIPLAPAKRGRSMDIWRETGKRLGAPEAQYFADGGFTSAADVPRPSSTAPYGSPISTGADATMQSGYDATVAWLTANAAAVLSGTAGSRGGMSGTWTSIAGIVQAAIPQARINSTYRPGDPGYHGKNKAVDFGFGSGPGGDGSAGLASIAAFLYTGYGRTLAELIYDGAGDSTPDVKNGADHVYDAATRAEHHNHVHAAVYDDGGLAVGAGYLPKATVQPERVLSPQQTQAFEQWMTSPAASPGYGSAGGGIATAAIRDIVTEVVKAMPPKAITVDARGFGADQIAQAVATIQRREEFLTGG